MDSCSRSVFCILLLLMLYLFELLSKLTRSPFLSDFAVLVVIHIKSRVFMQDMTTWTCSTCTFQNNFARTRCEMCDTPKPKGVTPPPAKVCSCVYSVQNSRVFMLIDQPIKTLCFVCVFVQVTQPTTTQPTTGTGSGVGAGVCCLCRFVCVCWFRSFVSIDFIVLTQAHLRKQPNTNNKQQPDKHTTNNETGAQPNEADIKAVADLGYGREWAIKGLQAKVCVLVLCVRLL